MALDKLPSALDVAKFVTQLAANDPDRPRKLTTKELQKILYYIQGWSLSRRDRPLFAEQIRAWRDGPVVRDVYEQYRNLPYVPVETSEVELPRLVKAFIASVWEDYRVYSERELIDKTHSESPWIAAREGFMDFEPSDVLIPISSLRDFFAQPSSSELTIEELHAVAKKPENAPAASWYTEPE